MSQLQFTALVVVHAYEGSSFVAQVDFQSLHYFLVLEFLEFGLELFPMFIHLRAHVVHIFPFEHQ